MSTHVNKSMALFYAFSLMAMVGCTTGAPSINTAADADVTFDGLNEIIDPRVGKAWARADLDLSGYAKILFDGVDIEYRPGGEKTSRSRPSVSTDTHYQISEQGKQRFQQALTTAFVQEMGKSTKYTLVTEPGPDVLIVRAGVLDVVSYAPPDDRPGRGNVYLRRLGEATLVAELHDGESDAILARIVDRRAAEPAGMNLQQSNNVQNASEVRRVATYWAFSLREALDNFEGWPES